MRRIAALLPVLVFFAAGSPAAAAVRTHRCPDDPSARCGTLNVPLDRSGALTGTIPIHFAYVGNPRAATPILALSGGPGQAGVALLQDFASSLRPATRGGRAVIVLDQRGTGSSGLLRCRALEKADLLKAGKEAALCAQRLGPRRDYYTSDDSVADMDALRDALGVQKWSVYGVSYGTKVAPLYAQRYPDRIDRLILDSVVEPGGPDPLYGTTFQAIPRVLGGICVRSLCRSVTKDVVADVSKLVAKLSQAPLKGYVVGSNGKRRPRTFGRNRLFATLLTGDFDESLRAELPTAVRSALHGDAAPILRLAQRAARVEGGGGDPSFLSPTLYAATVCTEETFPWDWNADATTRLTQARNAVAAMPADKLYPFDSATAYDSDEINLCSAWPAVQRPPLPPPGPLPDVPTLLVSGQDDLRTPLEGAQRMATLFPHATLISVPGQGHSVLGSDLTGCSDRALGAFFGGRTIQTSCKRTQGRIQPDGPIAASIRDLRPATVRGRRGRTVSAAALTVFDVLEQSADSLLTNPLGTIRGGGLRGGRYYETKRSIALRDVVYVPGVRVTGEVTAGGAASLQISGRSAAAGHIRIKRGRVTGVLGGSPIRGRLVALSSPAAAEARVAAHLRSHRRLAAAH